MLTTEYIRTKIKIDFTYLFLLLGCCLFFVLICITNLFHFTYKLNADIASDVILAKLIWTSKEIVPKTWYVANELRIICTPNISSLFYGITHNALLSTGLGCCFMTVGIITSIYYFMNTIKISRSSKLLMIFLCLMLPCSFISLELLYLFASYYAIHIIVLFLTLGFYSSYMQKRNIHRLHYPVLLILAFLLALQSVRGILVIWGPLLCVEVFRNTVVFLKRHTIDKDNRKLIFLITMLLIVSFIGALFPFSVGQDISRNIRKGFSKMLFTVIPDMGRAIGFQYTSLAGKIILSILCFLAVVVLFNLFKKLLKKEELKACEWSFLVLAVSPILTMIMVAFSTIESTERYYFMLLFMIAMAVVLVVQMCNKKIVGGIAILLVLLAAINIDRIYVPILKCDEPPLSEALAVTEYLNENEYSIAYATFENANTMSVLSNTEIIVASVADVSRMDICKWMTNSDWYVPNRPYDERTAYIITESEKESFLTFLKARGYEDIVSEKDKIGKYWIFVSEYNLATIS